MTAALQGQVIIDDREPEPLPADTPLSAFGVATTRSALTLPADELWHAWAAARYDQSEPVETLRSRLDEVRRRLPEQWPRCEACDLGLGHGGPCP